MVRYVKELANAVATRLKEIGQISESHRDYCGVGFAYQAGASDWYANNQRITLVKLKRAIGMF